MHIKFLSRMAVYRAISEIVLPLGLLALLTGLFWVGEHRLYPKIYLYFVLLPTFILVTLRPRCLAGLADTAVTRIVLVFFSLALLSLIWGQPEGDVSSLLRRPFVILFLFLAANEVAAAAPRRFVAVLETALFVAVCAAIYALARFWQDDTVERLSGYGAFIKNALIVTHMFGFFAALSLGFYFADRRLFAPMPFAAFVVLVAFLLATGSRTPIVSIAVVFCWLAVLAANRKAALTMVVALIVGVAVGLIWPEILTQRGFSYRPQIWADMLRQIREAPWFGHGFDAPIWIKLDDHDFNNPHNLTLAVMYSLGIVGAVIWLALYATALYAAWVRRAEPVVMVVSATVVYGLFAGMTEGVSFMSRPKEHWFLIWVPLALLAAVIRQAKTTDGASQETMGANG